MESSRTYHTLLRLAAGGMGQVEVCAKFAGSFQRVYALKRLQTQFMGDEKARTMFLDEARLAGLIRHPNVVSVIDVGVDSRGPFLVMEFIEGLSCSGVIRRANTEGQLLPLQFCLRIAHQVALGLHAAHELRDPEGKPLELVHRDVSPQNILIGFDGVARLTDFGIAKALGRSTETTTHLLKGKMGYMSPEQLRFEEPDRRSDLFAFGVVFYEMLCARRLYRAETPAQTARRILSEPPPDVDDVRDDVPPEIVALVFSLLAKEPADRPANAREVAEIIDAALSDLVAVEGRQDPEAYMRGHFAGDASELETRLGTALTMWERDSQVRATQNRRRRMIARVAAAGVLGVAGIAAVFIGMSAPQSADAEEGEVVDATEVATPGSVAAALPAPVRVMQEDAPDIEESHAEELTGRETGPGPDTEASEELAEATGDETPTPMTRTRRTPRSTSRRAPTTMSETATMRPVRTVIGWDG